VGQPSWPETRVIADTTVWGAKAVPENLKSRGSNGDIGQYRQRFAMRPGGTDARAVFRRRHVPFTRHLMPVRVAQNLDRRDAKLSFAEA